MGIKEIGSPKDTTDVKLVNPEDGEFLRNDDGTVMTITIHGPYSKRYKQVSNEQQNNRLVRAQRTGGKMSLTAEEIEASSLELLVRCTESWNITVDNDIEPFSEDRVREIYTIYPWIREEVEMVFNDTRAFLQPSKSH
jgi:hypothetical protein